MADKTLSLAEYQRLQAGVDAAVKAEERASWELARLREEAGDATPEALRKKARRLEREGEEKAAAVREGWEAVERDYCEKLGEDT